MPQKDKPEAVMIFIRPKESPVITGNDKDIRIAYGNIWIDFRDGKILIKSEDK